MTYAVLDRSKNSLEMTIEQKMHKLSTAYGTIWRVAALVELHGELASQHSATDRSGRADELAALVVSYADEVVAALGRDPAESVG